MTVASTITALHSSKRSLASVGCLSISLCINPIYGVIPRFSISPIISYIKIVYPKLIIELNASRGGRLFRPENLKSSFIILDNAAKYCLAAFPS